MTPILRLAVAYRKAIDAHAANPTDANLAALNDSRCAFATLALFSMRTDVASVLAFEDKHGRLPAPIGELARSQCPGGYMP